MMSGSPSSSGSPHQDHSLLNSPPGGLDKDDSSLDSSEQPKFRFVALVPLCRCRFFPSYCLLSNVMFSICQNVVLFFQKESHYVQSGSVGGVGERI